LQIAVVLLDDSEARKFVAGTGGFEPRRHCILENHDLRGCWQRTQKKPGSSFYMQLELQSEKRAGGAANRFARARLR